MNLFNVNIFSRFLRHKKFIFFTYSLMFLCNSKAYGVCFSGVYPHTAADKGGCTLTKSVSDGDMSIWGGTTLNINEGGSLTGYIGKKEGSIPFVGTFHGEVTINFNTNHDKELQIGGPGSSTIDNVNINNSTLTVKKESYINNLNINSGSTLEINAYINGTIYGDGKANINVDYDNTSGKTNFGEEGKILKELNLATDKTFKVYNEDEFKYVTTFNNRGTVVGDINVYNTINFEGASSGIEGNIVTTGTLNFNNTNGGGVKGNITVNDGNVNMNQNFTNDSDYTITVNKGTVTIKGGEDSNPGKTLTNKGIINVEKTSDAENDATIKGNISNENTVNLDYGKIIGRVDNVVNDDVMNIRHGVMDGYITGGTVNIINNYKDDDNRNNGVYDSDLTYFGQSSKYIDLIDISDAQNLTLKNNTYSKTIKLSKNTDVAGNSVVRLSTENNVTKGTKSVDIFADIVTEKNLLDFMLFNADTTRMVGSIGTYENRVKEIKINTEGLASSTTEKKAIFDTLEGDEFIYAKRIILNTGDQRYPLIKPADGEDKVVLETDGDNTLTFVTDIYSSAYDTGEMLMNAKKTVIKGNVGGVVMEDKGTCIWINGRCIEMKVNSITLGKGNQLWFENEKDTNRDQIYRTAFFNQMNFYNTKLVDNSYMAIRASGTDYNYMLSGNIKYDYGAKYDKINKTFGLIISAKKNAQNSDYTGEHRDVSQAEALVGLIGERGDNTNRVYVEDNSLYFSTITRQEFNEVADRIRTIELTGMDDVDENSEVLYDSIFYRVKIEKSGDKAYLVGKDKKFLDKYSKVNNAGSKAAYYIDDWTFAYMDGDQAHLMRNLQQIDDDDEFHRAINEASPDLSNALFKTTHASMLSSYNNVQKRLDKIRMLSLNVRNYFDTANNLVREKDLYNYYDEFYQKNYKDNNVWGETFGGYFTVKDNNYIYGYDAVYYGFSAGYDRRVNKYLTVGSSLTVSNSNVKNKAESGSVDKTTITSFNGNFYSMLASKHFFLTTFAGITGNLYDQERHMKFLDLDRTALADFSGLSYSGGATLGFNLIQEFDSSDKFIFRKINTKYKSYDRDLHVHNIVITPSISIFATYLTIEKYKETNTGSIGLEVKNDDIASLEGEARLTFVRNKSINNNIIMQNMFSAFINYNFLETVTKVKARYLADYDREYFEAEGWTPKPTTFGGSIGLYFMKADNYQYGFDYTFSASSEVMSHLAKFNFMFIF